MRIEYVTGDLLEAPETIILHGCNCQGKMGSGIAKLIRDRWPQCYDIYRDYYERHLGENLLGQIVWADVSTEDRALLIGNAFTQKFCGREDIRYCSYDAIATVFESLNEIAQQGTIDRIALPLIGAGLANGSWSVISSIIEASAKNYTPVVYLLDGKIPLS